MKVILVRDVNGLGEEGEARDVAKGYARNYLLPRGLAAPVTEKNRAALAAELERAAARDDRMRSQAEAEAELKLT